MKNLRNCRGKSRGEVVSEGFAAFTGLFDALSMGHMLATLAAEIGVPAIYTRVFQSPFTTILLVERLSILETTSYGNFTSIYCFDTMKAHASCQLPAFR